MQCFYHKRCWKLRSKSSKFFIKFNISHAVRMLSICQLSVLVCHLYFTRLCSYIYVFVCHLYVTRMYWYVISMSLVCTRMPSVFYSYILVCHPHITCMYSYVIRVSLVCSRMSYVCHSYVLVWHHSRMHSYVIRMSIVCDFTNCRLVKSLETYHMKISRKHFISRGIHVNQ